jgi:Ca2+-binding EF-hand superfamily protein
MRKFLIGGAAIAVMLASGAAFAQTAQAASRNVVKARVAKIFAKLDTNDDGFITNDEMNAREQRREKAAEQRAQRFDPTKAFDRIDLNHDGKITVAEADQAKSQRAEGKAGKAAKAQATSFKGLFARADTNKDDVITRAEFDAISQQIKARMEKAGAARGGMRMFDSDDANKDGKVSLTEMQQTTLARFDRLDLNHDGTISPEERQQARQQLKAQRHPS